MNRNTSILILLILPLYWNLQAQSKERALEYEIGLTNDFNYNVSGGIVQDFSFLGNTDVILSFDTEKAKLWKGGSFHAHGLFNYGNSLSEFVGDLQGVSNIEADNNLRLYQFYYTHKINNLELTFGQHDLNSEFAAPEFGGSFIHSSFGIQPDISGNIPVSIFPVATLGIIAKWSSPKLSLLAAIYNGNPGSQMSNPNSVKWKFGKGEGVMNIVEFQYRFVKDSVVKSSYKLGVWNHSAKTTSLNNQRNYSNNQGIYFIGDYQLSIENDDENQGLGAFVQLGIAPKSSNLVNHYAGLGINYKGLLPNREEDELGLAAGYASFNNDFNNSRIDPNHETVIELLYKTVINSNFYIQPDFQYVINPSGLGAIKNAFICSIRTKIEF